MLLQHGWTLKTWEVKRSQTQRTTYQINLYEMSISGFLELRVSGILVEWCQWGFLFGVIKCFHINYSVVVVFSRWVMSDSLWTPWTTACQAPLSMGFFRQEHWSVLPFPSPGDLPDPGTEPMSPAWQADSFLEPPQKPQSWLVVA